MNPSCTTWILIKIKEKHRVGFDFLFFWNYIYCERRGPFASLDMEIYSRTEARTQRSDLNFATVQK